MFRYNFRLYHFKKKRRNFCLDSDGTKSLIFEKKMVSCFFNKESVNAPEINPTCNGSPSTYSSQSWCLFLSNELLPDTNNVAAFLSTTGIVWSYPAVIG